MIYCQLRSRAKVAVRETLTLADAAGLLAPDGAEKLRLPCPPEEGVWKLEAVTVATVLRKAYPQEEVAMLGADVCYVHRVHADRPEPLRFLRTAAAFAILMAGSALGMAWFHSDVDMPQAQLDVFRTVTGQEVSDPRLIAIPYVIGAALGVSVFYALPSRKAVTPLEVKLTAYQEDMEKTEGKDMPAHD